VAADISDDIVWFIERHFSQNDIQTVYEVLRSEPVRTPRVARAVLFLSNGSLSLLHHYAIACANDVRGVLTHAEYVFGVSEMPMQVRDMTLPFWHERNRGLDLREPDSQQNADSTTRNVSQWKSAERSTSQHSHLANRRFALGKIEYFITTNQLRSDRVRCLRQDHNALSVVELPLTFVLEQIAERIEITEVAR
jgi:hypothetical protein